MTNTLRVILKHYEQIDLLWIFAVNSKNSIYFFFVSFFFFQTKNHTQGHWIMYYLKSVCENLNKTTLKIKVINILQHEMYKFLHNE